jgi:hypothetical protein
MIVQFGERRVGGQLQQAAHIAGVAIQRVRGIIAFVAQTGEKIV